MRKRDEARMCPVGGRRLRTLPLLLALGLALGACAAVPRSPDPPAARSPFEEFVARLGKVLEELKAAFKAPEEAKASFKAPDKAPEAPAPRKAARGDAVVLLKASEALERGEYPTVLVETNRVLAANPRNAEALELRKVALYRTGKREFEEGRYAESYRTLVQLAKLAPGYEDSAATLQASRDRLVRQHYSAGLRLFAEERVEEAIAEWRLALAYDPQHESSRRNLEQAERILKALEERRKQEARRAQPA